MNDRWTGLVGLLIVVLLAALLVVQLAPAARSAPLGAPPLDKRVTVTGQGSVSVKPDFANLAVSIDGLGTTVQDATRSNDAKTTAIVAKLKSLGVKQADIRSTSYNIFPERNTGTGQTTGYHVSSQIMLTIRDIDQLPALVDQLTQAGASTASNMTFGLQDQAAAEAEARRNALSDAEARADDLAHLAGTQRGEVVTITEFNVVNPVPAGFAAGATGSVAPAIQPNELTISAQVQVTYTLK